jgi:polar amino acid transport system substrate-binding protein
MRKTIMPAGVVAVALALAVATGAATSAGTFKFCTDPTFPPMESKTAAGKAVGFDVDLANAIAKLWKVKAKFVQTAFPGLLPGLASKRCNMVISGIFVTPDRVKQFPAVSYMRSHRALVVQAGNPKRIKGPNDLSGKNVAVQAGTKYEEYLKSLNDQFKSSGRSQMNLQSYPGDTDAIGQLLVGRADVVLTQDTSGAYQKKQHPGRLVLAYLFPESDAFGIYYRKSDGKLGTALRSAVKTLKKKGTLRKIARKFEIPVSNVK